MTSCNRTSTNGRLRPVLLLVYTSNRRTSTVLQTQADAVSLMVVEMSPVGTTATFPLNKTFLFSEERLGPRVAVLGCDVVRKTVIYGV